MAYTPGVGRVSTAIAEQPDDAWRLTIKGNTVAVVTDGSAVLGLGNIGPVAALPVMEGKAALFKRFAGIDAWPICLATQDVDEIVRAVELIAPGFGGINLEDIAAPRCFEVEQRLRERLDIPVFHDDQHGTAIVVLAALTNALRVVGKELADAGSWWPAPARPARRSSPCCSPPGSPTSWSATGRAASRPTWTALAGPAASSRRPPTRGASPATCRTRCAGRTSSSASARPASSTRRWIADMADDAIVFALANPEPEVDPAVAGQHAAVVASGRSDYPNQINNVLAFPGVFRGLLDARATEITVDMLLRPPGRSPRSSTTTSSTPATSSRACSTPTCPSRRRGGPGRTLI